jgi:processive 1,2-diacylglycerol beta-glucosyltransferase
MELKDNQVYTRILAKQDTSSPISGSCIKAPDAFQADTVTVDHFTPEKTGFDGLQYTGKNDNQQKSSPETSLPPEFADIADKITPWKPMKIFLVHGSHTGGHRSAAEALEQALERMPNVNAEVINALDHSGSKTLKNTQIAATDLVIKKLGKVRQWAFEKSFKGNPVTYWLGNTAMKLKAWTSKSFLNKINQEKPDLIISTHSAMNSMLNHWKEKGKIDVPVHSVVTDFRAHRMWAQDNIGHFYVAGENAAQNLEQFGIAPERISITGIPIKPAFSEDTGLTKTELREKLGLDPNKSTVLMMGGSLGIGPFADTAEALDKSGVPLQFVCITGKNETKKQELEELGKSLNMPMTILGYTNNVNEWMDASDVVISQPGGLTTSEIFARNLPMVIIEPEEGLAKAVLPGIVSTGAAFAVKDPDKAAEMVKSIVSDPDTTAEIQENLAKVGKKRAAFTIGRQALEEALKHRKE